MSDRSSSDSEETPASTVQRLAKHLGSTIDMPGIDADKLARLFEAIGLNGQLLTDGRVLPRLIANPDFVNFGIDSMLGVHTAGIAPTPNVPFSAQFRAQSDLFFKY